ncbi:coiled-coil domain-containing protein 93-like [Carassius carassius]|uniref:coiled-coil domain-containing protein 93-like n=1 Tax=Carassius carassius TaxID=217509 RepID=UPI0028696FCE|nr:coiled-coil domain-containing protein 93-like [Carassius carassius]
MMAAASVFQRVRTGAKIGAQYDQEGNLIKAETREDEEQSVKLAEILELLLAAGYFRARIKGLTPFDKVVGGMTWCITTCNFALTEKIVSVLPRMKCPHRLEPHQIQGLDFRYVHLYIFGTLKAEEQTVILCSGAEAGLGSGMTQVSEEEDLQAAEEVIVSQHRGARVFGLQSEEFKQIATEYAEKATVQTETLEQELSSLEDMESQTYSGALCLQHTETKQFFTLYNTLDDKKVYLEKEVNLLNSIHDHFQQAMASSGSKEQFLRQLEQIVEGIKQSRIKMEKKRQENKMRRNQLNDEYLELLDKQRLYFKTVKDFKEECRKNEMPFI